MGEPYKDMIMSYAPENIRYGSLITFEAGSKLQKYEYTAKLGIS